MDYVKLMDERQKHLHEHFPPTSKLSDPEFVKKLLDWLTFWRRNPNRFVQRYFGIMLYLYQHIILYLMDICPSIVIVAARSAAKSFIIAVYACKEAILRPGSLILVASATKKQAKLIVSEKIVKEILPRSPLLQEEIKTIRDSQNEIEVKFKNGSSIVVVVANENVRGYRATVVIYEEFRMIVKSVIDTVLSPTLYQRQIPFRMKNLDEYRDLGEEPKEIYISSSWYKSHWMWDHMKLVTRDMLNKGTSILLAMDYSIALKHEIKTRSFLIKERKKLDRVAWMIEYENQMVSENAHAYYTYEMLNRNRVLFYRKSRTNMRFQSKQARSVLLLVILPQRAELEMITRCSPVFVLYQIAKSIRFLTQVEIISRSSRDIGVRLSTWNLRQNLKQQSKLSASSSCSLILMRIIVFWMPEMPVLVSMTHWQRCCMT